MKTVKLNEIPESMYSVFGWQKDKCILQSKNLLVHDKFIHELKRTGDIYRITCFDESNNGGEYRIKDKDIEDINVLIWD